ncbi:MAG: adenylate/guanylate cyclase domain-containing protein [Thermoplasmata archaeon]
MESIRRLSAIMFTDMVGSTAMAQSNEAEALRLRDEQEELVRPLFAAHQGREVKSLGDGFLAEFGSALRAVQCALDIQQRLHERNAKTSHFPIHLRIGIHLGDVEVRGTDVLGDTVNVASRIEPLAEPGGICISDPVFGQVRNKVSNPIEKLEPKTLKNVQFPMDIYRIILPWTVRESPPDAADPGRLAVLPFTNMSPDPLDEFFAEGLTEEMISELSKLRGLRVIARTSVMRFRDERKGVSEIGKELNVGTVLEGSVRKAGNRIRITAQLIDAHTEEHLWSDRYDRELTDIFAVQGDISRAVAAALNVQFLHPVRERQQPTLSLGAYSLYLRGRTLWNQRAPGALREALRCFEEARDDDPKYAQAYSGIADCHALFFDRNMLPWAETIPRAKAAARQALLLNDSLADGHASLGLALYWEYDWDGAMRELHRAVELNPSYASAHQWLFQMLGALGRAQEAERELALAEEADPLSPVILRYSGYLSWVRGQQEDAKRKWDRAAELGGEPEWIAVDIARLFAGRGMTAEATLWLRRYETATSDNPLRAIWLGYLYACLGLRQDATRHLQRLLTGSKGAYVPPNAIAWTYAGLGEADKFFEWMARSAEQRCIDPYEVVSFPPIEKWRKDPRYFELLRRLNIPT